MHGDHGTGSGYYYASEGDANAILWFRELLDVVAIDFGELGVVENVGVAVGITSIALPVSKMQSTSGFVSTKLI
jgi:hypothetical protein